MERMRFAPFSLLRAWFQAVAELRRRKRQGLPIEPITVPLRSKQETSR
jgi:hypothetical protein